MYLLIVFVLDMDSLDFLILILNLCIICINLDLQIFIKSNSVYFSIFLMNFYTLFYFLINVRISIPSRRT
jgi:hypothetical protein